MSLGNGGDYGSGVTERPTGCHVAARRLLSAGRRTQARIKNRFATVPGVRTPGPIYTEQADLGSALFRSHGPRPDTQSDGHEAGSSPGRSMPPRRPSTTCWEIALELADLAGAQGVEQALTYCGDMARGGFLERR